MRASEWTAACLNADTPWDFPVPSGILLVSAPWCVILLWEWLMLVPMAFQTWLAWVFTLLVPQVQITPTGEDDFSLSMEELYALCLPLNVPGDIHAWVDPFGLLACISMQSCPSLSKILFQVSFFRTPFFPSAHFPINQDIVLGTLLFLGTAVGISN